MAEKPLKILELTFEELTDELRFRYGKGTFHAAAIFRQIYRRANADIGRMDEFSQSPELAEKLREDLDFTLYPVIEQKTQTGLLKFVTRLKDGLEIESVIVPMAHHKTLCISSQVGCRMECAFCETAQLGFLRDLSVEEIVGQAYRAKVIFGFDIKNLVFMGMGEPFDNLDNVVQAIRVMNDQRGLDFARRHITVSTVGIPGGFRKLTALNWPDLKLAVSLNAPNDRIRSQIMPVNHLVPMESLKQTLLSYPLKKKAAFFIEYVLIKFLNDSREHARELAEFLRPLNTKVNIIPFNPRSGSSFTPPSDDDVQLFCNWLAEENVFVRKRSVKGQNMMAACGQLGNRELKRGKKMKSRERIRNIIAGETADRCGFWLGNPDKKSWQIYHKYFGTDSKEKIRQKMGDDIRWICPQFILNTYQDVENMDMFYASVSKASHGQAGPLSDCEDVKEVELFNWPDPRQLNFDRTLTILKNSGNIYRLSGFWTCFYHTCMDLFGMENYMIKMHTHPRVVHAVTDRVCRFYYDANERFFSVAGDLMDGFFFGNDFGTQTGLICGPEQFEEFIMPWFRRFTDQGHEHGYQVILHSCGAIHSVIDDLIDAKVDCLHPLQAKAANMDAETLARDFKGKISFMGGIDTQDLLVNATPGEVGIEVERIKRLLGPNLIVSPSHEALLPNVPPENVQAMAEAAIT